jgi:hypothetical protein
VIEAVESNWVDALCNARAVILSLNQIPHFIEEIRIVLECSATPDSGCDAAGQSSYRIEAKRVSWYKRVLRSDYVL